MLTLPKPAIAGLLPAPARCPVGSPSGALYVSL